MARYDGFRFSGMHHIDGVSSSLPNNTVDDIQEDRDGMLWVHTLEGYCVYDNYSETFDTNTHNYLGDFNIQGTPDLVYIDKEKNCLIVEDTKGMKTRDYLIKKKLFEYKFPDLTIREITK